MDKNEVRQLIMNRRHELSDEDIEMQSELIIDRLKKSDIYKTSENVFLYMSYNREVDTYMLLSQCFMDGKKVYAPKVLSKTQMEFYCLSVRMILYVVIWELWNRLTSAIKLRQRWTFYYAGACV